MMIWLNGTILPEAKARIAPTDRGFLLGDGLFETMMARVGAVVRLDAHLARLRRGAEVIGLALPDVDVAAALADVLAANGLRDASLRLTVTRGSGPRGVLPPQEARPTVMIAAFPLPGQAPPPARCVVARTVSRNERSPLSSIKSLNYLDNILARQEAARHGGDEAILTNSAGRIAEASASNVFILDSGGMATPPVSDGALPGVTRAALIAMGAVERSLTVDDLFASQGVFLSGSLGLRVATHMDGEPLPPLESGRIESLQKALWPS